MTPIKTIAFVGLGHMGAPMAAHLAAKGFALALFDRRVGDFGPDPGGLMSMAAAGIVFSSPLVLLGWIDASDAIIGAS